MDSKPTNLDFALIGHLDSWGKALKYVNALRDIKGMTPISLDTVKDIYSYIPPRDLFNIEIKSRSGELRRGVYIETFISPDELDGAHLHSNIKKVKEACEFAASLNVPIVSLGGFTSIILENSKTDMSRIKNTFFTTGNTLTAAFIADTIERICVQRNIRLSDCRMLIVGATGDIGSACVRYFSGKIKELLICGRRPAPLQKLAEEFSWQQPVEWSVKINELLPFADIIVCVASSLLNDWDTSIIRSEAIICDAGYPKNIDASIGDRKNVFWGGMGIVSQGYHFAPDYKNELYSFSIPNIAHGCMMEAVVLSMENRAEAFSKGRGNITKHAMEEMLGLASKHGIDTAPFFNDSFNQGDN
jgi:fatty aldehyde-generating acyl-ACP reductase